MLSNLSIFSFYWHLGKFFRCTVKVCENISIDWAELFWVVDWGLVSNGPYGWIDIGFVLNY